MNVQDFLALLKGVKQVGPDRWTALCPGHDDKRPSLSIREASDGKVLIRCWSRCTAEEIVAALGLTMADLFPDNSRHIRGEKRPRPSRKEKELRELAARLIGLVSMPIGGLRSSFVLSGGSSPRMVLTSLDEARWVWGFRMEHVNQLLLGDPEEKLRLAGCG